MSVASSPLQSFVSSTMEKSESLQEFYKRKFDHVPGIFSSEIGHFNLFRLEPYSNRPLLAGPEQITKHRMLGSGQQHDQTRTPK